MVVDCDMAEQTETDLYLVKCSQAPGHSWLFLQSSLLFWAWWLLGTPPLCKPAGGG
jgi:hypothetical protein